MKRFLTLMLWVAVGTPILALATAGSATAGIPQGAATVTHGGPVQVINLHLAYEARLGQTTLGKIAGIVYPPTQNFPHRGGNNCAEPYCPVRYNGGSVQVHPHVYLLLWGPNWLSDPNQAATATYLKHFYSGLGVAPQDNWSTVTSQYGGSSGSPVFGQSVFVGAFNDKSTPPTGVGQSGLAAEAVAFATTHKITDLGDAQIVVATQSGTCPQGFVGTGCAGSNNYYCAWHSSGNNVSYTNLPYVLDAGKACGEDFVNSNGTDDGFSIVGGHEYAGTITDPYPPSGWFDSNQSVFGEIADKCAWDSHSHDVTLSTGLFAMQPLWSNVINNTSDECVMPIGGKSDIVTVANVVNQSTYKNSNLSLSVGGTSSGQHPLTWSATGLPPNLTISSGGNGVGVISGKITAAPGTYKVTVNASDPTGAFGWTVFKWTVLADVGTPIVNQASGTCLNDRGYFTTPGNPIFMWKCLGGAAEMFTQPTNAGEVIVLGQCLTDPPTGTHHGGPGTLQVIEPCTGAANQEWFHNSNNEYVLQENLLCLTDPGGSIQNGAPVTVENCTGATDEKWSGS